MTQAFTQSSLLRLAYCELPICERLETEYALTQDPEARQAYRHIVAAKRELPKVLFSPKTPTIDAVLAYSRKPFMEPSV